MTKKEIAILIVDDHKIVRDGIQSLLMDHEDIIIIDEASNGREALEKLKSHPEVDVVLMDINMPEMDGIECAEQIKQNETYTCKVLALTMLKEDQHIRAMVEAGASGYILKESGEDDLVEAIRSVADGKPYFSDEATAALLRQFVVKRNQTASIKGMDLTEREIEILQLITNEFTNQEIAEKLFISVRTVDAHRRNLMEKIGAKNMAGLVRYAIEKGYV